MDNSITDNRKKLIYLISSFGLIWMGLGLTFCYEMGKHGLRNIDWGFIFQSNLPVVIIAGSIFVSALGKK